MIDLLGWIGTIFVLTGYFLNSSKKYIPAMFTWVVGDIIWIIYDVYIQNWSHLTLSFIIIGLNVYGIYNIIQTKYKED